jgi:hypothetical protein
MYSTTARTRHCHLQINQSINRSIDRSINQPSPGPGQTRAGYTDLRPPSSLTHGSCPSWTDELAEARREETWGKNRSRIIGSELHCQEELSAATFPSPLLQPGGSRASFPRPLSQRGATQSAAQAPRKGGREVLKGRSPTRSDRTGPAQYLVVVVRSACPGTWTWDQQGKARSMGGRETGDASGRSQIRFPLRR